MKYQIKQKLDNKKGITLIALIISIIVMLILAGVSINAIVGDNGIITSAILASIETKYANYVEELSTTLIISGDTPTCVGEDLANYINSISDEDLEELIIINGELYYIGSDETNRSAAEAVGIITDLTGNSVTEVLTIIESVIVIDDEDEYIGTELIDRTANTSTTWNLAVDYDSSNKEIMRYGTGYYLLEPDIEYTINGETVTFSNYYVIDYTNHNLISSNNLVNWNFNSTVAVTEGLVLNLDTSTLANINYEEITVTDDAVAGEGVEATAHQLYEDGTDLGITMYGDVVYDDDTSALVFNESEDNPLITEDGDTAGGGYLKLTEDSEGNKIDFSDGFSFEIYANLSRLSYNNGYKVNSGLFCRMSDLFGDWDKALKFLTDSELNGGSYILGRIGLSSSWSGSSDTLATRSNSVFGSLSTCIYSINTDLYISYVYTHYDDSKDEEYQNKYYDNDMIEDEIDRLDIFVNGELFGSTYFGADSYEESLDIWNNDDCAFYFGVCPRGSDACFYYVKGTIYTCRLYTCSMTAGEVLENYDKTLKYRNSFVN